METYAVVDFETTGLSPRLGARPIEVAVVMVSDDRICDRYQSLINPGIHIGNTVQALTGITNAMVRNERPSRDVMKEAVKFVGKYPLVAHRARFDQMFWDIELGQLQCVRQQDFLCSEMLARRILPGQENYKLQTLIQSLRLPNTGNAHRALADAEATAHLMQRLKKELRKQYGLTSISEKLMCDIHNIKSPKHLTKCVLNHCGAN